MDCLIRLEKKYNITNLNGSFYSKESYSVKFNYGREINSRILLVSKSDLKKLNKVFFAINHL